MCQLEKEERRAEPTKRVSRVCVSRMGDKKYLAINSDGWNALEEGEKGWLGMGKEQQERAA